MQEEIPCSGVEDMFTQSQSQSQFSEAHYTGFENYVFEQPVGKSSNSTVGKSSKKKSVIVSKTRIGALKTRSGAMKTRSGAMFSSIKRN